MKNKNNNGVTLVSLSVYIIVSVVVLASLTFLNINFMSQIADLSIKSSKTNEILKAESYLISDLKSANNILDYSQQHLTLDNGVKYQIRYRSNEKLESNQTYDTYELYRNGILITDKMTNLLFDYDNKVDPDTNEIKEEWIKFSILDSDMLGQELYLKIGKGY